MSSLRVYFADENGKELKDCPHNGKTWIAFGPSTVVNGEYVKGTHTSVEIASFASMNTIVGHKRLTMADFPGHTKIRMKFWKGPKDYELLWLVP